jgi:hypothetical protein
MKVGIGAAIPTLGRERDAHGVVIEGRAYRDGKVVCDRVHVTMARDGRLGLAPHERRSVVARFLGPRPDLRGELAAVVRRRGAAARRAAERIEPIEVVSDEGQRFVGYVLPPQLRTARELREVEFVMRERS